MQDVIDAWQEIARAEERYRELLRKALADGVQQVQVAKALDRTRESIRRDAMSEQQRAEFKAAEAERLRKLRTSSKTKTK